MRTPIQTAFVAFSIEPAKAEIQRDIAADALPAILICRFADLHKHVDANLYGGLGDLPEDLMKEVAPRQGADDVELFPAAFMPLVYDVQAAVDTWLRTGAHKAAAQHGLFETTD